MLEVLGLSAVTPTRILAGLDGALSSAVLLVSFALMVYVLTHNASSGVGRAFTALMCFVTAVYIGDVAVINAVTQRAISGWLRFQWLGIAFVPAAYLHLSQALLYSVDRRHTGPPWATYVGYALGTVLLVLALGTNLIVRDGVYGDTAVHLVPGPLFWTVTLYFAGTTILGATLVGLARAQALTADSRRRLTYLALSFVAPALGVFPFLVVVGLPAGVPAWLIHWLSAASSLAVMGMLVVMAYSVAYFGVVEPDRVVKQAFIEYLLRGPLVGVVLLLLMLSVPQDVSILGLRRGAFQVFAVVGAVVLLQVGISLVRPWIDRFAYRRDAEEVRWLRELESRLMASTDLRHLLENVLISACDLVRSPGGAVAVLSEAGEPADLLVRARVGTSVDVPNLPELAAWLQASSARGAENETASPLDLAYEADGAWLILLQERLGGSPIGVIALARGGEASLEDVDVDELTALVERAGAAAEDMLLQRQVFAALQQLLPDIDSIRRYSESQAVLDSPVFSPEFPALVRGALRHYYTSTALRDSPLQQLRTVRQALSQGGTPAEALRGVLALGIEALRPAGERTHGPQWDFYNVLEMKYVQGRRAKDIAAKLALSESDFYRKQRSAITELTRILQDMEERAAAAEDSSER